MAKTSSNKDFSGELLHFNAVRMRVTGAGNLILTLNSLDVASHSLALPTLAMEATTNREPTILANYIDQYGQLEFATTLIDETLSIDKIVIFIRPVASGYPQ